MFARLFRHAHRAAAILLLLPLLFSSVSPAPPVQAQAQAGNRKLLVDIRETGAVQTLRQSGARLLAEYEAFSLWRVNDAAVNSLTGRSGVTVRDDFDLITVRQGAFSPLTGAPQLPAGLQQQRISGEQLWLVQFIGPIKDEWLDEVAKLGLTIVSYVPNNAYLVWGDGAALSRLDALQAKNPVIQWNGPFHAAYRLAPALQSRSSAKPADLGQGAGEKKDESADLVDVTVQFYARPGVDASLQALLALGGNVRRTPSRILSYLNVSLQLPYDQVASVASWPDVVNVEPWVAPRKNDEVQNQIIAGNVVSATGVVGPAGPGYLAWLASKGFPTTPSSYPIVDVVDDGVDIGNAAAVVHPDFYEFGSKANPDRVVYIDDCTTDVNGNAVGGHGNLNASIVAGYNITSGVPFTDSLGYNRGLGVSPYGRVAGTKIFRNVGPPFYDVSQCGGNDAGVVAKSYDNGAHFTSNSWGATVFGAYDVSSQAYDALTRDARSTVAGNQQMLHIFSAGNDGSGANSIGSPGTAKNVLTVGATENVRDNGIFDGCNLSASNNADDIATYSSRGPTDDLRVKPDIQAPGSHIQGAASQDPLYNGTGVCGAASGDQRYYPAGQTLYTWSSGTSHSTPGVAGAASLAWEYYGRALQPGKTPSPAMLKALLLNTTRYLTGVSANDALPSNSQGWGDANLGNLTDGTTRAFYDQSHLFHATGAYFTAAGVVSSTSRPVRVTLVWTDAPGTVPAAAYVNNLDLEVTVGGNTYKGNVFAGQNSVTGGTADFRNNVESVFLPAGVSGPITVRVIAANIAGNGVPDNADATDQDFALIVSNATITESGAAVAGVVTDATSGLPIADALVEAANAQSVSYAATTAADGTYAMQLPAGAYTPRASHPSYVSVTAAGIVASNGVTQTQNFALSLRPFLSGTVTSEVTGAPLAGVSVTASGPLGTFATTSNGSGNFVMMVQPGLQVVTGTLANYLPGVVFGVAATATATTTVNIALPGYPQLPGYAVAVADPDANGDGNFVPGEIIRINRGLTNTGTLTATGATATLSVVGGQAALIVNESSYPQIGLAQAATNTTPYQAIIGLGQRCPDVLTLRQVVTPQVGPSSVNTFTVPVGRLSGAASIYTATAVPKFIPDNNPTGATVPLTITTVPGAVVQNLDVRVTITHTYDGDLTLRLISPSGTTVQLSNRRGSVGDNFTGTIFDDEAAIAISSGAAPFTGRFRPETPLSALNGEPISGTWKLVAIDNVNLDVGTVLGFFLDFYTYDCSPNVAQSAVLAGQVTDAISGQPVTGTVISAPIGNTGVATTTTGPTGNYQLPLPAGVYTATASDPRYFPTSASGLAVTLGQTTTQNFVLNGFPRLTPRGAAFDDTALGNGNGRADAGEVVLLTLSLQNTGTHTATDTIGLLGGLQGPGTLLATSSLYPTASAGAVVSNTAPYVFYVDPAAQCGDVLRFTQNVSTSQGVTATHAVQVYVGSPPTGAFAATHNYTGPPVAISASGTPSYSIPITVTGPSAHILSDLDVRVNINHTYDQDLAISLVSPLNTVVSLVFERGGSGDNFLNTVFDDEAASPISGGAAPFTGRFRPESPLSALDGEPISGTWTLRVEDHVNQDGGVVNQIALEMTVLDQSCSAPVQRPAPSITQVTPPSTVIGQPGFVMTVTGESYFDYLSKAYWNGAPLTTTYVNSMTLAANVPAALVAPTEPSVIGGGPKVPAGPISITVQTLGVVTPSNTVILNLEKANQTITFGPLANRTVGDAAFTIAATASSGLPVQFSASASPSGACTLAGTLVTVVAAGTCTITASQPGNESYNAATPVQQSFTISSLASPTPSPTPPAGATPTPSPTPTGGKVIFLAGGAKEYKSGW